MKATQPLIILQAILQSSVDVPYTCSRLEISPDESNQPEPMKITNSPKNSIGMKNPDYSLEKNYVNIDHGIQKKNLKNVHYEKRKKTSLIKKNGKPFSRAF